MEEKIKKLAKFICEESLQLNSKERLYIAYGSLEARPLVEELICYASSKNVFVYTRLEDLKIESLTKKEISMDVLESLQQLEDEKVRSFDAFIYIKFEENDYELKTLDSKKRQMISHALQNAQDKRVNEKKWVLLKYPSMLDAYKSNMSYREFYQYAIDAMTMNYHELYEKMQPLKKLMEQTKKVRIVGQNTDITFSVEHMPAIICAGEKNIPDGEIYTAPIKDSVEGVIAYNTPSPYLGNIYHHVFLTFSKGKIIKATSDEDDDLLSTIFNVDEGAKYIGEFAIGLNKNITKPMGNILFDEKIFGSIHFTPGAAYEDCDNGNISEIHWDLVLIQTKEYGGGKIYFDDVLIRDDGLFVIDSLKALNE